MRSADQLIEEYALKFRCWRCEAEVGWKCQNDSYDHGLYPCYPHESRAVEGATKLVAELLEFARSHQLSEVW